MKLPDQQLLDDSEWQLAHAADLLAPLIASVQERPEPTDPAHRPAYEHDQALLRALRYYVTAVGSRIELLNQTFTEMDDEMHAANGRYREMRLARDFAVHEAQSANARYYKETDIFTALYNRLYPANRA